AAGLVHAALDVFGQLAVVAVAGRELRPGVADADHRAPVEHLVRDTHALEPAAVIEALLAVAAKPLLAATARFPGRGAHAVGDPSCPWTMDCRRRTRPDRPRPARRRSYRPYSSPKNDNSPDIDRRAAIRRLAPAGEVPRRALAAAVQGTAPRPARSPPPAPAVRGRRAASRAG